MHLPRMLARVNRRVVNPIQRTYAGIIPFHGIIEHVGRRTGARYRTPVLVFRAPGGFAIIVGYGLQSDWLKNLQAAGGAGLRHRGKDYVFSEPRLTHGDEAYKALPRPVRAVAKLARVEAVLRVTATSA
ncbi:MAG TPA: nitroreductase family deazaflavin-dependent oxidoreductase [Acidimicrobiales bacterium]|nr:nitroreductase family deazaflavin-dependent oxidoreductase [Acidimicrobiales bacterium]